MTETELVAEIGRWLNDPIVICGLIAIFGGGGAFVIALAFGREDYPYKDSTHRRPKAGVPLEPWMREPLTGERASIVPPRPNTQVSARHRFDTMGGGTRRLTPYPPSARAMVRDVDTTPRRLAPDWVERMRIDDEEASWSYRAGETGRVRRAPAERDVEEEGGADRERRELPREAVAYGEESREDTRTARPEIDRFFKNTITGEVVFLDSMGRRIDFDEV